MKTIIIEHEVKEWMIKYDAMRNNYIVTAYEENNKSVFNILITKSFLTFDEAVGYVRKNLL